MKKRTFSNVVMFVLIVVIGLSFTGCPGGGGGGVQHEEFPSEVLGYWAGYNSYYSSDATHAITADFQRTYCDITIQDLSTGEVYSIRLWCSDVIVMDFGDSMVYGWYWENWSGDMAVSGSLQVVNEDGTGLLDVNAGWFLGENLPYGFYVD
ncbi:hypothetical protein KAR91_58355 [Candidatus Pacearchaeota archaeon]|nr:hypothetical protein [Candidatus Pacearchaeota archaeon]